MQLWDETERIRIGVSLEEAIANALYHGNLEVSSELRETDHNAYCELVDGRFSSLLGPSHLCLNNAHPV